MRRNKTIQHLLQSIKLVLMKILTGLDSVAEQCSINTTFER